MVKFGVEVEGYSPCKEALKVDVVELGWSVGADSSIRPRSGEAFEVRSSVYDDIDKFAGSLRCILREMKKHEARVNHRCGLHVHVSDAGVRVEEDLVEKLANEEGLFYSNKWRARRYAKPEFSAVMKNVTVRIVNSSRLEFRGFDGAISMRHIMRSVKKSLELFNLCIYRNDLLCLPLGAG